MRTHGGAAVGRRTSGPAAVVLVAVALVLSVSALWAALPAGADGPSAPARWCAPRCAA